MLETETKILHQPLSTIIATIEEINEKIKIYLIGDKENVERTKEEFERINKEDTKVYKETMKINTTSVHYLLEDKREYIENTLNEYGCLLCIPMNEETDETTITIYSHSLFCIEKIKERIIETLYKHYNM
eukprot:GHVR01179773.1.p1 GENE.GHVR01179773.1~~GHVR01179773.1.p1  ORF type:complete len:130 (+),score=25.67 GHVR01179773.1:410-799(+)